MTETFHHPLFLVTATVVLAFAFRFAQKMKNGKKTVDEKIHQLYKMVKRKHGLPETIPGALYGCPPHVSEKVYSDEELAVNAALEEVVRLLLQQQHGTEEYRHTAARIFEVVPYEIRREVSPVSREAIIHLLNRQPEHV